MWMMVLMSRLGRPWRSCSAGFRVPLNVPEYTPFPWWCILSIIAPCRRLAFSCNVQNQHFYINNYTRLLKSLTMLRPLKNVPQRRAVWAFVLNCATPQQAPWYPKSQPLVWMFLLCLKFASSETKWMLSHYHYCAPRTTSFLADPTSSLLSSS